MKVIIQISLIFMLVQVNDVFSLVPHISKGKDACPEEFPYQASIQWGIPPVLPMKYVCGSSIIHENWILFAGHCLTLLSPLGKTKIKVGIYDLSMKDKFMQILDIDKIIVHEDYPGEVAPNDIALIKSKAPITFNERVAPVNLPTKDSVKIGDAVLSGWGSNCNMCSQKLRTTLQTTTLPIVTNEECQMTVKSLHNMSVIYENQLCTISRDGINTCPGDSGGPLVQNINGVMVQVGIISWDLWPCESVNAPTVYTRVSFFIDWINKKIKDN